MSWLRAAMSRLLRRSPSGPPACASPELLEAERALADTEERLGEVKAETPEIMALTNLLRQEGRDNDFANRLWSAFGGARE